MPRIPLLAFTVLLNVTLAVASECLDVVTPHVAYGPAVDILVDRCTGATWTLSATQGTDDKGKLTTGWYWSAVSVPVREMGAPSAELTR
jgi:hypothetical protein